VPIAAVNPQCERAQERFVDPQRSLDTASFGSTRIVAVTNYDLIRGGHARAGEWLAYSNHWSLASFVKTGEVKMPEYS
jgi:hypothetical protein